MLGASLGNYQGENRSLLDDFKTQDDVEMYTRLPDYADFHGFELPNDM